MTLLQRLFASSVYLFPAVAIPGILITALSRHSIAALRIWLADNDADFFVSGASGSWTLLFAMAFHYSPMGESPLSRDSIRGPILTNDFQSHWSWFSYRGRDHFGSF